MNADRLELEGIIIKALGNGNFMVSVSEEHSALCTLSGKMRLNSIKVIEGDRVVIEVSPYDLSKGRIKYRSKG